MNGSDQNPSTWASGADVRKQFHFGCFGLKQLADIRRIDTPFPPVDAAHGEGGH